jgi:hypothetical protein
MSNSKKRFVAVVMDYNGPRRDGFRDQLVAMPDIGFVATAASSSWPKVSQWQNHDPVPVIAFVHWNPDDMGYELLSRLHKKESNEDFFYLNHISVIVTYRGEGSESFEICPTCVVDMGGFYKLKNKKVSSRQPIYIVKVQ